MKRMFFSFLFIGLNAVVCAQSFEAFRQQAQSEFDRYKEKQQREFKEYRDRINAEFAGYMRSRWIRYDAKPADPVPARPEPPKPVVKDPDSRPSNDPVPFDKVLPTPDPVLPSQPVVPLPVPDKPIQPSFSFAFYGTPCAVSLDAVHRFSLRGVDENTVADAWALLSSDSYLPVVSDCLVWRDKLKLCDWGYVRFVECMTTAFFPADKLNEARLMQMYILTQSGYKVRIARADERLVLLLPSMDELYEYPYLAIGGCRYYITDPALRQRSFYLFDREFPKERFFSLQIDELPMLSVRASEPRLFVSKRYPDVSASIRINRNLIDFYNDYPLSSAWNIYAQASLSTQVKEQLYPVLRRAIAGKEKRAAANVLIDFVQTAFGYKTDEEQFGKERALFADETFSYPFSDCEDRSILYSILIRDLLGLKTVLLHYPGHLATAVRFEEEVAGDYILLDGHKYIVCDPTYIGASVGDAMPQFKHKTAEVIRVR